MHANAAKRTKGTKPGPTGKGKFRLVKFSNAKSASWRVTGWTLDGRRVRENFADHAQAVVRLQELEIQSANLESAARPVVSRLTPDQVAVAEAAFAQLDGKPLLDAVKFYLDHYREPLKRATVAEAFDAFIGQREAKNLRKASLLNLRNMNRELLERYGNKPLSDVIPDALRSLIFKPTRTPVSCDGYRRGMNAFLQWAKDNRYVAENPCASIEPVKLERPEPVVLTVPECRRLLDAAAGYKDGRLVPFVALSLFAGLRPTETGRLSWERIDLEDRVITIGADVAKLRGKRLVSMSENLVKWLQPFALARAPIVGSNHRKDFEAVKELAGFGTPRKERPELRPWTQDAMRHTALSYHLADGEHEGRTALWAGNSPTILQKHYRGLVKKADAAAFWALAPAGAAENLVILPTAATAATA